MTTTDARALRIRSRPPIGAAVHVNLVRLAVAVVAFGLCYAILGFTLILPFGILLTIAAIAFPRTPSMWGLAILIAAFALHGYGDAPYWQFFVALAGVHALHQFGMMLSWLPATGRIQLSILGRMLRTYLIIQIPAQLVSYAVLTVVSGASAAEALTSPVFGLLAAAGMVVLVIAIMMPILRGRVDRAR